MPNPENEIAYLEARKLFGKRYQSGTLAKLTHRFYSPVNEIRRRIVGSFVKSGPYGTIIPLSKTARLLEGNSLITDSVADPRD